jgi:hypothetical protein
MSGKKLTTTKVRMFARIVGCLCLAALPVVNLNAQDVAEKQDPSPPQLALATLATLFRFQSGVKRLRPGIGLAEQEIHGAA